MGGKAKPGHILSIITGSNKLALDFQDKMIIFSFHRVASLHAHSQSEHRRGNTEHKQQVLYGVA